MHACRHTYIHRYTHTYNIQAVLIGRIHILRNVTAHYKQIKRSDDKGGK